MNIAQIIPFLATNGPLDVFRKVVVFNETAEDNGSRAIVRLGLTSGFTLEGVPVKMDKEGNVVFLSANHSISYVNTSNIAGVEIMNPEVVIHLLTNGAYFEVPKTGIPTNLELKRALKATSDSAQNSYGFAIESDLLENGLSTEAEKFQFQQFLNHLRDTLQNIAQDHLGIHALKDLKSMAIDADKNDVSGKKDNGRLNIGVNFKTKFSADFQDRLKETLELHL